MSTLAGHLPASVQRKPRPILHYGLSGLFGALAGTAVAGGVFLGIHIPEPHPVDDAIILGALTVFCAGAAALCARQSQREFRYARLLAWRARREALSATVR